jgi:hypothetical protein
MKRFNLLTFAFLCSVLLLPGAFSASAATVTVDLARFCADCARSGRAVQLKPVTVTTRLDPTANQGLTDSAGVITFTRVPAGTYTLVIRGVVGINGELLPDLAVTVPDTDDALQADDLVTSEWTRPPARVLSNVEFRGSTNIFTFTNGVTAGDVLTTTDGVHWHAAAPSGGDTIWTNDNDLIHIIDGTSATLTDSLDVYGLGTEALSDAVLTESSNIHGFGDSALSDATLTHSFEVHAYGFSALRGATLVESSEVYGVGSEALRGAVLTNSIAVYAFGSRAGYEITGPLTNVVLIGKNATASSGTANQVILGPGMLLISSGGIGSTDTTAAVSIAATGWTNTFGKNAVVYYDGTNITAKVYNNAGTAIYTNTAALSGGSVLLQPSGKVILSGTGVNGRAAPF